MAEDVAIPEGFELETDLPEGFELEKISPLAGMLKFSSEGANVGLFAQTTALPFELSSAFMNIPLPFARPDVEEKRSLGEYLGFGETRPLVSTEQIQGVGADLGIMYRDIEDVPEQFRPFARGGEAVGAALPFAAAPFAGAARAGAKPATGMFRAFVEPARTKPGPTALLEGSAAVGSGVGAGVAEAVTPDNPLTRFGGELAGGLISPFAAFGRVTGRLTGGLVSLSRDVAKAFSQTAAKNEAARHIQGIAKLLGESPVDIARGIKPGQIAELGPAAGSESLAISALEKKLINDSHVFGLDVQKDLKRAIDQLNFAFGEVAGSGDPQALKSLALARKEYARVLIDTNVSLAERRAVEAAESIVPGSSTNTATNRRAKELLLEAERGARSVENEVWGEIDKTLTLRPSRLNEVYKTKVTAGLLPGESVGLPEPITREIKRLTRKPKKGGRPPKPPTVERMLRLRSRILNEIRTEGGSQAPNRDKIRRLDILQEAILDDLAQIPGTDEARAFSKDLNDRFTRGYVGKLLARDPRGGEKIPGDVALSGALSSSTGKLSSEQLESAVTPFGRMEPNARFEEMRGLEGEIIRDMASSTIDPSTGNINPNSLARFRNRNKELLSNFPELDRVLSNAEATTRIYGGRIKKLAATDKRLQSYSAFSKVLANEDPVRVIRSALQGSSPVTDMDRIFLMARKDPKAVDGARRALLDVLFADSTTVVNLAGEEVRAISGKKLLDLLNAGDGGVLRAAKKSGILNDGQINRIKLIADEADRVQAVMNFPGRLDKVIQDPSALTDVIARAVGANLGSHSLIAKTTGAQLVMASAGSRMMRKLLEKTPAANVTRILQEAVRNPELMKALLVKRVGSTAADKASKKALAILRKEGLMPRVPLGVLGTSTTEIPEILEE